MLSFQTNIQMITRKLRAALNTACPSAGAHISTAMLTEALAIAEVIEREIEAQSRAAAVAKPVAPAVDLSVGRSGVITFEGGVRFFCLEVEPHDKTDGLFLVRLESGHREAYIRNGSRFSPGGLGPKRIVDFLPCGTGDYFAEASKRGAA